ncbi:DMT family transporter [Ideonella sp. DXS22W]|uniref:DMT family transporter n=1 Tax=Pseudaquabacterium inlustre TaxID=2984192 RepID=A0ABU9CGN6_9BURK
MKDHTPGAMRLALLATMAIWGGNLAVVKLLLERFDPMALSALRMAVSALALLAVLHWQGPGWPRLSRRQFAGMLVCGLLMIYLNQICFTLGVQRTVAANAALVIALNPLVSSLAAAALLGDRLTPARLAGVVLGFSGVAVVVLHRPGAALGHGSLGDLLVFGSVLTWVAGGVLVQRLTRAMDSTVVSAVVNTLGSSAVVLHALLDPGTRLPDWGAVRVVDWLLVALSGLLATAVGALVWNRALVRLGVARTALYAYWVPIFGVGFAVLLLGEPLTVWHGVGLAAVLSGTWLGTRKS